MTAADLASRRARRLITRLWNRDKLDWPILIKIIDRTGLAATMTDFDLKCWARDLMATVEEEKATRRARTISFLADCRVKSANLSITGPLGLIPAKGIG